MAVSAGATAKDLNVTGITTLTTLKIGNSIGITTILDEDNLSSDSASALASQQSIKAYVDAQVTAQDLDFGGGSGNGAVDLDSQSFTISGTNNEIQTTASGTTLTIGLPDNVNVAGNLSVAGNISGSMSQTVFSGVTTVSNVTEAANATTAALVVSGGIGVAKNIVVGGGLTVTGDVSIGGTLTYEDVTNIDSVGFLSLIHI